MTIIPAIIPQSFDNLESDLLMIRDLVRIVQIDICDGRLTPSASWPYIGGDIEFKEILAQQRGFPSWEHFDFEIDLMVLNPVREYEQWIDAGASRIIFHYKESETEALKEIMKITRERGVETGLALHLDHDLEVARTFEGIECLQLMGIQHIGFQGEPFDEKTVERVRKAKELYPELQISVDGGVNEDSAQLLIDAGANRLIMGSAIFGAGDIPETISYFESLG